MSAETARFYHKLFKNDGIILQTLLQSTNIESLCKQLAKDSAYAVMLASVKLQCVRKSTQHYNFIVSMVSGNYVLGKYLYLKKLNVIIFGY